MQTAHRGDEAVDQSSSPEKPTAAPTTSRTPNTWVPRSTWPGQLRRSCRTTARLPPRDRCRLSGPYRKHLAGSDAPASSSISPFTSERMSEMDTPRTARPV